MRGVRSQQRSRVIQSLWIHVHYPTRIVCIRRVLPCLLTPKMFEGENKNDNTTQRGASPPRVLPLLRTRHRVSPGEHRSIHIGSSKVSRFRFCVSVKPRHFTKRLLWRESPFTCADRRSKSGVTVAKTPATSSVRRFCASSHEDGQNLEEQNLNTKPAFKSHLTIPDIGNNARSSLPPCPTPTLLLSPNLFLQSSTTAS